MNPTDWESKVAAFKDDLLGAIDDVSVALDGGDDERQLSAGRRVQQSVALYNTLLAEGHGKEREELERTLGRRITDLRRTAAQLTQRVSGRSTEVAIDRGHVPFLLRRDPGKSIVPQRAAPLRDAPKFSVGGECDAWCGKCKEVRTHNAVALVGGEPKQVVCQVCGSRHNYRPTRPMRARAEDKGLPSNPNRYFDTGKPRVDPATQKREEDKRKLREALQAVDDPRPFDPKARYKAGEIIVHPDHGKGKIENVLKGSLLVRFLEGLRPLDLR